MSTEVQEHTNGAATKAKVDVRGLHHRLQSAVEATVDALGPKSKAAYLNEISRIMQFPAKERARVLADWKALFELADGNDKLLTAVKTAVSVTVKS